MRAIATLVSLLALEGMANEAERERIALRVAEHDGAIVFDLARMFRRTWLRAGGSYFPPSPSAAHRASCG